MKITVIGTGLTGKVLANELQRKGYCSEVTNLCTSKDTLKNDLELLFGNKSKKEAPINIGLHSDVIILDIPVALSVKFMPGILSLVDEYTVIMDVACSKEDISKCVKRHKKRGQFVPTHPVIEYSTETPITLENKTCVICADDSALFAVERIAELYESLNMKVVFMKPAEHDKLIAHSHAFRIFSYTLSHVMEENKKSMASLMEISSPEFLYNIRSGNNLPDIWATLLEDNYKNIAKVLSNNIKQVIKFKKDIENKRSEKINKAIKHANETKNSLK